MDEITNILSITQMRLNKFKVRLSTLEATMFSNNFDRFPLNWIYFQKVCGSLTNLLKIKGGDGTEPSDTDEGEVNAETSQPSNVAAGQPAQQDMQQKMSSGFDKLDSLLTKTENAQASMAHQNKQMKSFLK